MLCLVVTAFAMIVLVSSSRNMVLDGQKLSSLSSPFLRESNFESDFELEGGAEGEDITRSARKLIPISPEYSLHNKIARVLSLLRK